MYNTKGTKTMDTYIDITPVGEMLNEEFLIPNNLSQNALAIAIGVPANRINGIIKDIRGISADTDLRLCKYFGLSEGYFLRYQDSVDLAKAKQKLGSDLDNIISLDDYRKKHPLKTELMEG